MKRITAVLILLAVCVFLLTACSEKTTYLIATDNAYQPFCYIDNSGESAGFDIELIKAVAKARKLNIEIVSPGYIEAFEMLDSGEADAVIAAVIPDSINSDKYDFSDFYYNDEYAIAVLKGSNAKLIEEINKGLEKITEDGTYKKIYGRYFAD